MLAAGTAALLSGAIAQDALMRLRGSGSSSTATTGTTSARAGEASGEAASTAANSRDARLRPGERRTRRAQGRRSRQPTAAPVRSTVQAPTTSPNVARPVQPIQVGIPDPAVPPPRRRPRRPAEEDPYAQLGLRLGGVTVLPAIQQSVGYDSNPNRDAGRHKGSTVLRTDAEVRLQSDWPAHALTGLLRGSYSAYPNVKGADRPEGEGRLGLRLDVSRDTQVDLEGRFALDTQRPGSPDLNAQVSERPLVLTTGAAAGVTQRFNRLLVGLRGTVDRTVYEDGKLPGGTIIDQSDRDATQYGLRLRAGYELTPGVIPFVEALADTRVHDRSIDNAGFRRDSDGLGLRAGTTFEITRTLTGEASAGVQRRTYDDPRLKDLRGPLVEASLIWSATPLTTVRLRAQTSVDETTIPFSSGILTRTARLEVQHDLRRNLSVTGIVGVTENDYKGVPLEERTYTAGARLEYKLTRSVALRASFTHERLKSNQPGSDYSANTVLLGLRFNP
ncbi:MAG TPA: outer membrane beta-barrel protein [Beijerinckiaceae bacterium]